MTLQATPGCPYRVDPTGAHIQSEASILRTFGPAARVMLPGDIPAWSVTDPSLIRRLLVNPDVSKDAAQHWAAYIAGQIPADWPQRIWVDVRNALTASGKEHRRLRRPLARAFSPRRVRSLVPRIEAITAQLLDGLEAVSGEVIDLRARFAWRLPLLVINELFQTPDHLHHDFRDTAGALFATDLSPAAALTAWERLYELIAALITHKAQHPADDLSSDLIAARDAGDLTDRELADSFVLIISAGHETTVNLLDHAVVNLTDHRDQLALVTGGQVSWDAVVEETLRHQAPVANLILRFAATDVVDEATGVRFAQGDAIVISYAAANRDPHVHGPDANAFDVQRPTSHDHLAFGFGPHLCVGAELARLEARIGLQRLFERFPDLHLAVDPDQLQPLPSYISNGHQRLPVRLGP
ncbi:cytochrome P450 family protein [Streptomyces griseorubiginosus]|uniref:cytochrome P450 family protein n=1 Tax=Streptomyces griseorubiginosus TaxID=67304 RepID=UPI0036E55D47